MRNMDTEAAIKVIVCCHKKCEIPDDNIYLPIHVGKAISNDNLGIQGDDNVNGKSCDNISKKNGIYCEMTAMYWAWKNIKKLYPDIEYVGLCHYRRFFYCNDNPFAIRIKLIISRIKFSAKVLFGGKLNIGVFNPEIRLKSCNSKELKNSDVNLESIVTENDIIVTRPVVLMNTSVRDFMNIIGRQYIEIMDEIINSDFSEYTEAYNSVMSGSKLISANMIILRYNMLDDYCKFIFGVLEKHIDYVIANNICVNPYEEKAYARISGYLAELITNTFVFANKKTKKIRYVGKAFIE